MLTGELEVIQEKSVCLKIVWLMMESFQYLILESDFQMTLILKQCLYQRRRQSESKQLKMSELELNLK